MHFNRFDTWFRSNSSSFFFFCFCFFCFLLAIVVLTKSLMRLTFHGIDGNYLFIYVHFAYSHRYAQFHFLSIVRYDRWIDTDILGIKYHLEHNISTQHFFFFFVSMNCVAVFSFKRFAVALKKKMRFFEQKMYKQTDSHTVRCTYISYETKEYAIDLECYARAGSIDRASM